MLANEDRSTSIQMAAVQHSQDLASILGSLCSAIIGMRMRTCINVCAYTNSDMRVDMNRVWVDLNKDMQVDRDMWVDMNRGMCVDMSRDVRRQD